VKARASDLHTMGIPRPCARSGTPQGSGLLTSDPLKPGDIHAGFDGLASGRAVRRMAMP